MNLVQIRNLVSATIREAQNDNIGRMAAALSYFTLFSLAPILVIVVAVAGLVLGEAVVESELMAQFQNLLGDEAAMIIQNMIDSTRDPRAGTLATLIGFGTLLFGATTLFFQLEETLNTIWHTEKGDEHFVVQFARKRFTSFLMVLGIGLLLIGLLIFNSRLAIFNARLQDQIPQSQHFFQLLNLALTISVLTISFALVYKILPRPALEWNDVLVGGALTAILFTMGQALITRYLGYSSVGSAYGAAGALVVLLIWVFYSMQVFLLGAEFTYVYAHQHGSKSDPNDTA